MNVNNNKWWEKNPVITHLISPALVGVIVLFVTYFLSDYRNIKERVAKIDVIEEKVNKLDDRINKLENKLDEQTKTLTEIQKQLSYISGVHDSKKHYMSQADKKQKHQIVRK